MGSESLQHKLDRVRRPRVQITYDLETNGAMVKTELPFVVGVLADLSGQPATPLAPMKERKFVNIDRDNFSEVMTRSGTRLAYRVDNKITGEGQIGVDLSFKSMDDFEPAAVARQVPAMNELLQMRHNLSELLGKLQNSDKLEIQLTDILGNTEKALALAKELGVETGTPKAEGTPNG